MPRLLLVVVVLAIALPRPAHADVPVLVVDGRGFGHGVGMAQDGAYWMGRDGASTEAILAQFFPGVGLGRATGNVRVPVLDTGPAPTTAVLTFPEGGLVRDAPPHRPAREVDIRVGPGARVTIGWDGSRYRVAPPDSSRPDRTTAASGEAPLVRPGRTAQAGPLPTSPPPSSTTTTAPSPNPTQPPAPTTTTTTTTNPPPTTTTTPSAPPADAGPSSPYPIWSIPEGGGTIAVPGREGRRYRGAFEATAGGGTLRLVNEVDVEVYLKGMGEVLDPSWPQASLRAQAIAARTYALRAMAVGGEICDTQRCQVYLGADAEYAAMSKAVDDSRGRVLTFGRALASAVYSANGGGHSASREEGFGQSGEGYPYLRPAPYPTADPEPWTVQVALADVAARLAYPGTITAVTIADTGPSGRAQVVTLDGSAGSQPRTGLEVARALRLRSTLFSVRLGSAAAAPAPPAGDSLIQAPPEAAAGPTGAAAPEDRLPVVGAITSPGTVLDEPRPVRSPTGLAVWAGVLVLLVAAGTAASSRPMSAAHGAAVRAAGGDAVRAARALVRRRGDR